MNSHACLKVLTQDSEKKWMKSYCSQTGRNVRLQKIKHMQLGRFIFGSTLEPEKVFIQVAGDREGGEFFRADLPLAIQKLLSDFATVQLLTPAGHQECDRMMLEFWKENF